MPLPLHSVAVVAFAILQSSAVAVSQPAPGMSVGAWLGLITASGTIVVGIFTLGVLSANQRHLKSSITEALTQFNEKLDAFARFVEDSSRLRMEHASWRATTDGRLVSVEHVAEAALKATHGLRGQLQEWGINAELAPRVVDLERERRTGPADRRHD